MKNSTETTEIKECERCESELNDVDYTGGDDRICRACYCDIQHQLYADGQDCDMEAVREVL